MKTLIVSGAGQTRCPIELFWTAKKASSLKMYLTELHLQGGKIACSSRCARRSRGLPSEEEKGENLGGGSSRVVPENGDALSDLPPWEPLKRLDMRRGAIVGPI